MSLCVCVCSYKPNMAPHVTCGSAGHLLLQPGNKLWTGHVGCPIMLPPNKQTTDCNSFLPSLVFDSTQAWAECLLTRGPHISRRHMNVRDIRAPNIHETSKAFEDEVFFDKSKKQRQSHEIPSGAKCAVRLHVVHIKSDKVQIKYSKSIIPTLQSILQWWRRGSLKLVAPGKAYEKRLPKKYMTPSCYNPLLRTIYDHLSSKMMR